jgi:threonine dehydratase
MNEIMDLIGSGLAGLGFLALFVGAVGLAALVAHRARLEGTQCATVLCGANLSDADRAALLPGTEER